MSDEIWHNIFDGLYSVSNLGRVKSNDRQIVYSNGVVTTYKGKILKPEICADGHLRVTLSNSGRKQRVFVHRLVAEAFIPNPNNYPIVNHKDEVPSNNCVDNLEWCTYAYNNTYNNRHERIGDAEGHIVGVYDVEMHLIHKFPSITKASKYLNVSLTTLWQRVKNGKSINDCYVMLI